MEEESISIAKEEALSIFAFYKYFPKEFIENKKAEIYAENHFDLYRDMRWMLKILEIYLSYKSNEVWYLVSENCKRIINDIYKTEDTEIEFKKLNFLIWFIFIHRNIKDYREINKLPIEKNKMEAFKTRLLELNAIGAYQTEMF